MASYNRISDNPPPLPQSRDEEESSEQSGEGFKEPELGKHKQKTPHVKLQLHVNKKFNAQKTTVRPPEYSSDSGEEEEDDDDEGEAEDESENRPHSLSESDFSIKHSSPAKLTSKDSRSISKRPSAGKDDEKGLENKKKAKFDAEQLKTDKPSSVSAASTGKGWSDEEVINLLQCVIDFKAEKGVHADDDPAAFHKFFERKFQSGYSKTRVYEKVRGLKKKYCNNLEKFEKVREDTGLSKADFGTLNLSKKISGGRTGAVDFELKYPLLSQSFEVDSAGRLKFGGKTADELSLLKENMHLIGDDKAKELEGKWKTSNAVFFFKSLELMKEQSGLVLEAMHGKELSY